MRIGQILLAKHEGNLVQGIVIEIYAEEIDIKLDNEIIIRRKFWEVRKPLNEK
jgi:hypothetical protein